MNWHFTPHANRNTVLVNYLKMEKEILWSHFQLGYQAEIGNFVLKELPMIALRYYQTRKGVQ